jgi:hypothetical protein
MHLRGADHPLKEASKNPHIQATKELVKAFWVENLMTLKQACPSEYQRAQGAFKDSMIH